MRKLNLTNQRFGRLVVRRFSHRRGSSSFWVCRCDCGKVCLARVGSLRNGTKRSCGCLRKEIVIQKNWRHGYKTRNRRTPEYTAWVNAKKRCLRIDHPRFPDWGGRGIKMCKKFQVSFGAFLSEVGRRPSKNHVLDRIDNDGHYEPGNLRWTTQRQSNLNQRRHIR